MNNQSPAAGLAAAEEFLQRGDAAQRRYEQLRSQWFTTGVLGLARMSWGCRLLHFGLLGLLDEDPTGGAWFGASPLADDDTHCTRVFLATDDAQARMREAYRCILEPLLNELIETAEGFG